MASRRSRCDATTFSVRTWDRRQLKRSTRGPYAAPALSSSRHGVVHPRPPHASVKRSALVQSGSFSVASSMPRLELFEHTFAWLSRILAVTTTRSVRGDYYRLAISELVVNRVATLRTVGRRVQLAWDHRNLGASSREPVRCARRAAHVAAP